jgi:hypothetical protein
LEHGWLVFGVHNETNHRQLDDFHRCLNAI